MSGINIKKKYAQREKKLIVKGRKTEEYVSVQKGAAEECGAAQIIEMTLIMPVVLICIWMLVYLGSYILQSIYTYNTAQKIAMIAAREAGMPGYMYLYEESGITQATDFLYDDEHTGRTTVNKLMSVHNPYRFITDDFIEGRVKSELEQELKELINKGSFLAASDLDCIVKTSNNFINKRVEVYVTRHVRMPDFLRLIGIGKNNDICAVTISEVCDSADFIRNADMIIEAADYIIGSSDIGGSEKSLREVVSSYKLKFKEITEKLGLE